MPASCRPQSIPIRDRSRTESRRGTGKKIFAAMAENCPRQTPVQRAHTGN